MKTIARNTFVAFENTLTITTSEQLSNLVCSLTNGIEEDLFVVLHTVAASNYIGFSLVTPQSGDRTNASQMAKLACENYADGALVYHHVISPRSLMHETRMMARIDLALAENSVNLMDYGFIRKGKLHCFTDVTI
jgi:hypothetical protein